MKPNELRNKINERNWELLLDAINEGKVVPIIGEDLIIQLLDSNNNDLRKYRDEACRTSYLDYYRKSIQELSAN